MILLIGINAILKPRLQLGPAPEPHQRRVIYFTGKQQWCFGYFSPDGDTVSKLSQSDNEMVLSMHHSESRVEVDGVIVQVQAVPADQLRFECYLFLQPTNTDEVLRPRKNSPQHGFILLGDRFKSRIFVCTQFLIPHTL